MRWVLKNNFLYVRYCKERIKICSSEINEEVRLIFKAFITWHPRISKHITAIDKILLLHDFPLTSVTVIHASLLAQFCSNWLNPHNSPSSHVLLVLSLWMEKYWNMECLRSKVKSPKSMVRHRNNHPDSQQCWTPTAIGVNGSCGF